MCFHHGLWRERGGPRPCLEGHDTCPSAGSGKPPSGCGARVLRRGCSGHPQPPPHPCPQCSGVWAGGWPRPLGDTLLLPGLCPAAGSGFTTRKQPVPPELVKVVVPMQRGSSHPTGTGSGGSPASISLCRQDLSAHLCLSQENLCKRSWCEPQSHGASPLPIAPPSGSKAEPVPACGQVVLTQHIQ